MARTAVAGSVCDPKKLNVAIIRQKALIEQEINVARHELPTYMNDKIRDGGMVEPHDNGDTLVSKVGVAGIRGYNRLDNRMGPLVDGSMEGLPACSQQTVRMGTQVVDVDPNACEGVELVDFANGYYFRGCEDHELKLATRMRCKEQLAKEERRFVKQILEEERKNFVQTGILSADHHLINLVIANGEANAVVRKRSTELVPKLTKGGWPGAPEAHVSIPWLQEYRKEIIRRKITNGHLTTGDGYILEVEMTRDAWQICKLYDLLQRSGPGGYFANLGDNVRLNIDRTQEMVFGSESKMKGRRFETWDEQIRVVFVDQPIRGYLKPAGCAADGSPVHDFVRIMPVINVPADEGGEPIDGPCVDPQSNHPVGGLIPIANPDYDSSIVSCPEGNFSVLELIPHVDSMSFVQHGLAAGIGPEGVRQSGVHFEVDLLQGDALSSKDCPNFFNGYYQYAMRHRMRFCNKFPEYSGFILHQRQFMPGYDITSDSFDLKPRVYGQEGVASIDMEALVKGDIQSCADASCAPQAPACTVADNITKLNPSGVIPVAYFGEDLVVYIPVCRDENCADFANADVDYEFADGTALSGTHFQPIDENGAAIPLTGTLSWAQGESGCKYVCVKITGALPDTVTAGGCCDDEIVQNLAEFTFKLLSATGTTLDTCVENTYQIQNYS